MADTILVTYASRAGSTAGVAEAIGRFLSQNGAQVEVRAVQSVTDLSPYRAVVAGSAVQGGAWLPEAMDFVRLHRDELAQKPFATFLVCMTLAMKNNDYQASVADWLKPVRALVNPVSEACFAGALDISKIPAFGDRLKFRISVLMGVWTAGDHRDWNAIHTWANKLSVIL